MRWRSSTRATCRCWSARPPTSATGCRRCGSSEVAAGPTAATSPRCGGSAPSLSGAQPASASSRENHTVVPTASRSEPQRSASASTSWRPRPWTRNGSVSASGAASGDASSAASGPPPPWSRTETVNVAPSVARSSERVPAWRIALVTSSERRARRWRPGPRRPAPRRGTPAGTGARLRPPAVAVEHDPGRQRVVLGGSESSSCRSPVTRIRRTASRPGARWPQAGAAGSGRRPTPPPGT